MGMAAAEYQYVNLADRAKQTLDGITHNLASSLLLLDDSFALIVRHSYGLAAFYHTFQPLNVLPLDIHPHSLTALHSLHDEKKEEGADKRKGEQGDGWDEWQWDEKSEAAAASSDGNSKPQPQSTSASVSSLSATVSPAVTVLLSGFVTPSIVDRISCLLATLRSSAPFTSSRLHVFSAQSGQAHESAGWSSYSAIESKLPPDSSLQHLPLTYSLLLPSVFFLPSVSPLSFTAAPQSSEAAADVLPSLASLSSLVKSRASVEVHKLSGHGSHVPAVQATGAAKSSSAQPALDSLSAALTSLLISLHLRPDVFSSGRVGQHVGQRVREDVARHIQRVSSDTAPARGKTANSASAAPRSAQHQAWQSASVVLVDRIHDMASVCSHTSHVLDHMYYTQRRTDELNPTPLPASTLFNTVNALHHSGDKECGMLLNALVNEPLPAALRIASRLLASSSADTSRGRRKGDVDIHRLGEQVRDMEQVCSRIGAHHGLYEISRALVQAESDGSDLEGDSQAGATNARWRQLQSLERVCLSALPSPDSSSSDTPLAALVDLLQSHSATRTLTLLPLLSLSSFLFSALGDLPLSEEHEQQYRQALLHRVAADLRAGDELAAKLVGNDGTADSFVSRSMTLLQQMRYARSTFSSSQLSSVVESNEGEPRVAPFVARLLSLCLDPAQSVADLHHHFQSTELSAFDQLRRGAKDSLKAATSAALRSRAGDSAALSGSSAGNVQQSLSSFLSLGSSVVKGVTSSLSSSKAGASSSASHPTQHSTLVYIVLGDISWLEVSNLLRVAAQYPASNVLIGCTGIADAEEMAWKTFAPDAAASPAAP